MSSLKFSYICVKITFFLSFANASTKMSDVTKCPDYQNNIAVFMDDFDVSTDKDMLILNGSFNITDDIENSLEVFSYFSINFIG